MPSGCCKERKAISVDELFHVVETDAQDGADFITIIAG